MYMPVSLPSMSITQTAELLQTQDRIIKSFPEVELVFGKAERVNTATDPASTEMFETVINLKPESQWRPCMTVDQLVSDMDRALGFPGLSNVWTMPIKVRIDMLSTGIRGDRGRYADLFRQCLQRGDPAVPRTAASARRPRSSK
jgi:Cu(I)/Ag(I) efflux system membrane protein CusA/SilA